MVPSLHVRRFVLLFTHGYIIETSQTLQKSFVLYISVPLFRSIDDDAEDEDEVDEEEAKAKPLHIGLRNQLEPKEGVAWRCAGCRVVNTWTFRRCIACDDRAPHAVSNHTYLYRAHMLSVVRKPCMHPYCSGHFT